jgi:aspartate beta-hydroxylase
MTTTAIRHVTEDVRRCWADLVDALTAAGDPDAARATAQAAVDQGVWRHPEQRPVHYIPTLPPRPVYDPADFWFCSYLEDSFPQMRAELDAVTDPTSSGFLPVEEPLLGAGRWEQVTFYEAGHRFDEACARFPVTAAVLDGIPETAQAGVGVASLSWLYPGTRIKPHCGGSNARLRVHLGLNVPGGAQIRVGPEVVTWEERKCIVFDDSFEHEVWHNGDRPRVVLLLDVSHPDLDEGVREAMLAHRSSFDERITRFVADRGIRRVEVDGTDVRVLLDHGPASQVQRYLRERGAHAAELVDGVLSFETSEGEPR